MSSKFSDDSPPGRICLNVDDFLKNRSRPGNPESVRQIFIKTRIAEEQVAKYRSKYEESQLKCERLMRERENFEILVDKLQAEHRKQVDDLLQQLHKKDRETYLNRYEAMANLLKSTAASDSLDNRIKKPICLDASTEMNDLVTPWQIGSQRKLSIQKLPQMCLSIASDPLDDIDRRTYNESLETISKLEGDLFSVETELKLAKIKIRRYERLEAEKMNLENCYMAVSDSNDVLIHENENLKRILSKLQENSNEMASLVDCTLEYQSRIDDLKAELLTKDQLLGKQGRKVDAYEQSYEKLKSEYKTLENNCASTADCVVSTSHLDVIKNYEDEIARLRDQLAKYENQLDTTKIVHYRSNPLDLAHEEHKEFSSKKRKLEDSSCLCDDDLLNSTIRRKINKEMKKQINDLQFHVHKLEKENMQAEKIHSDIAKKYRAAVTALCGVQVKMKEDDIVQIESIYDPGNYFMFKVAETINVLQTDYLTRWDQHFHDYIERKNSIPSFLAAVTLDLTKEISFDD